jgi:hypothetical protein
MQILRRDPTGIVLVLRSKRNENKYQVALKNNRSLCLFIYHSLCFYRLYFTNDYEMRFSARVLIPMV